VADKLSLGDLAAAVVAQDEEIRDDLKGLVSDMIKHMRYTMRHGEASAKTALSKQIIPQLLTAINKVDSDESEKEEKAAYDRMMAQLRGDPVTHPRPDTSPEATEDAPAPVAKKTAAPRKKVATKKVAAKKVSR
jgi:hypothetical protein